METLVNLFNSFLSGFLSIWDFIIGLFKDHFTLLRIMVTLPQRLAKAISLFPPDFTFFMILTFSVVIVYKILGRDS